MASFLIYAAGLVVVAAVAWIVARPWFVPSPENFPEEPAEKSRWEREKEAALAAIREAEFDHELGKLSDEDYREMRSRLEQRAVDAMRMAEREERE